MRKPEDIKNAVDMLIDTGVPSVITVSKIDEKFASKSLMMWENEGMRLTKYYCDLPPNLYYCNGICYALTRKAVQEKEIFYENRGLIIDRPVVNIDTPLDLEIARMLMKDD